MASRLFQTQAIVLTRRDFREADRLYTAISSELGKIDFIARGGHKVLAKLTPHLEMVAHVDLLLVQGRTFLTVAGVDRREGFPAIYRDAWRLLLANNAQQLVDVGMRFEQSDPGIFLLLDRWLRFVDHAPELRSERRAFALGAFTLRFIDLMGYRPELYQCLHCRSQIQPGAYRWHGLRGGVVCHVCAEQYQSQWHQARRISDGALKLLRIASQESFDTLLSLRLSGEDIASYHEAIESLVLAHFPKIPGSSIRSACYVS